jgi:membrane-associated phospholipid phosphatase
LRLKVKTKMLLVILCFAGQGLYADNDEGFTEGLWRDLISPVTTPAYVPLAVGSTATLLLYSFKYEVGDPMQRSWSTNKPLGPSAKFGDVMGQWVPNLAYAAGMAIEGWGFSDKIAKQRTILMLKASIYSGVVDQALAHVFNEPRPNRSNDLSFPSGHSTEAFAFASVVGAEHEWYWGVGAYSLATFVALSRINDNMHRLHDVVGGATLGLSYGLALYYRAHGEEVASKKSSTVYQILPLDGLSGGILTATREF